MDADDSWVDEQMEQMVREANMNFVDGLIEKITKDYLYGDINCAYMNTYHLKAIVHLCIAETAKEITKQAQEGIDKSLMQNSMHQSEYCDGMVTAYTVMQRECDNLINQAGEKRNGFSNY